MNITIPPDITNNSIKLVKSDVFSREFCSWFYNTVNRLQPECNHLLGDDLNDDIFCENSIIEINCFSNNEKITKKGNGNVESANLLKDFLVSSKLLLNPNLESGVMAQKTDHGLLKVLCCGSLHHQNSFVGIFEQDFGLIKCPITNKWKIMVTKINNKQCLETTLPQLPSSSQFEIEA